MSVLPAVILKNGKEEPVKRFHPWIFSGAISKIRGKYQEGDIAEVFSAQGEYLATGYLLSGSIAVKLFSFQQQDINPEFWHSKLSKAYQLRKDLGLASTPDTNAFRLVHNEGDGFPGLIIDIYGKLAVVQAHSVGMYLNREVFARSIREIFNGTLDAIYDKSAESLRKMTDFKAEDGFLFGSGEEFEIHENGNSFLVNPAKGQKTGFFLDQRDNRALISRYANGKRVLNMYGYTGGFSVYAAKAGAESVHTVDSSAPAIELANRNFKLNGFDGSMHQGIVADAREFLMKSEKEAYDLIVLDPPAFAKNLDSRNKALSGYISINSLALSKIKRGGVLFTFSCSQVVDRKMFYSAITAASIVSGRGVQVIHQLSQPADHPMNLFHQEGEYLKGLVLRVD